jgi:toxin ParE1/3/4
LQIQWTEAAEGDLDTIERYIARDKPTAAVRQVLRIVKAVEQILPKAPFLGRPGRVPGTREMVVTGTPYIVAYRVKHNSLQILRVIHSARKWPEAF